MNVIVKSIIGPDQENKPFFLRRTKVSYTMVGTIFDDISIVNMSSPLSSWYSDARNEELRVIFTERDNLLHDKFLSLATHDVCGRREIADYICQFGSALYGMTKQDGYSFHYTEGRMAVYHTVNNTRTIKFTQFEEEEMTEQEFHQVYPALVTPKEKDVEKLFNEIDYYQLEYIHETYHFTCFIQRRLLHFTLEKKRYDVREAEQIVEEPQVPANVVVEQYHFFFIPDKDDTFTLDRVLRHNEDGSWSLVVAAHPLVSYLNTCRYT